MFGKTTVKGDYMKRNKVSEYEFFSVVGALRLNPDIIKVLETVIERMKTGDISEEKLCSVSELERLLNDTKEQLEAHYGYLEQLKKKLA